MPRHRFWLATGATVAACLIVVLAAMPSVVAAQTTPPASPPLPAPDASTLLHHMQDRVHRLRTFRSDEVLRPAATPVETLYAFQAPDRIQMDLNNESHTIFVGATRYTRDDRSGSAWQAEDA